MRPHVLRKFACALLMLAFWVAPAAAEGPAFSLIRIGDADGFGFAETDRLARPTFGIGPGPADSNANGRLEPGEYLPDLNRDGGVWWRGGDNFDNRSAVEAADTGHRCDGCRAIGPATRGSNWTDLALSASATAPPWPDLNGPALPNNATFVFDFTVARDAITEGAQIFFNLVFADYDVDPAVVFVRFADARPRLLAIPNQLLANVDGLIQQRSAVLQFAEVFTADADGDWHGRVAVIFDAPIDPFTAFDYVELNLLSAVALAAPATAQISHLPITP